LTKAPTGFALPPEGAQPTRGGPSSASHAAPTADQALLGTSSGRPRLWAAASLVWLVVVLLVGAHQWQFWRSGKLNTDVLALLPVDERAPEVTAATRTLAERASRQVIVMVGAPDWPAAQRAALAWSNALVLAKPPLRASGAASEGSLRAAIDFYRPWRDRLLTPAQRRQLEQAAPAALVRDATGMLYQPATARLSPWINDPLGLWQQWWTERAGETRARPRDGALWLSDQGMEWVVLPYEITGSAFALNGDAVYGDALRAAREAAQRAVPGARTLAAGLPLHAEAAAVQASHEINTIGWGSLAAVLLLVWLAFRSLRPILLVGFSLVVGTATALSVTAWVFGEVHLIALVFGASLVGVAEDYGIHYFATRQGEPQVAPRTLMRQLLPGLALALATSVVAYLVLGLAPFPGLRQMALFSAVGLVATFVTAICWFPLLDRGVVPHSDFADAIAASLERLPLWRPSRRMALAGLVLALLCAAGLLQLRASDDIRQLQSSPPELVQAQLEIGRALGTPSAGQFYLVRGDNPQQVLAREEALKERLAPLVADGGLGGWSAVSDWVPSLARQRANSQLTARTESAVLAGVGAALGEKLVRPAFASTPLTLEAWLAHPVSTASRSLWLGDSKGQVASVVMLRGLHKPSQLPRLEEATRGLEGVRWVDKPAEVSALLGRYRASMTLLLLTGYLAVLGALLARYGRSAWRAWVPTAVASVVTVALLGWFGQPFQLFNVLALVLLLGIGVDYGIFLLEHPGNGSAWLAVVMGAASTWLAFGLLSLSSTPALRAFGLTLLLGIALVWALSPWLRAPARAASTAGVA
jgi:predicted exporter